MRQAPTVSEYRQPSVSEAVSLVMASLTREYRRSCIRYWRDKYGEAYATEIEREVRKKWNGKHDAVA